MGVELRIAKGKSDRVLKGIMANRHGLIAGATGTGKSVTLRVLAEQFSRIGVPVFMADVKGDLSGIAAVGLLEGKIRERVDSLAVQDFTPRSYPVTFWDVFGENGHPLRATISEMGPLLLSRLLSLNETQSAVLTIVFKIADDQGLLLLDLKDLQSLVQYVGENGDQFQSSYGNISKSTAAAIQRAILTLSEQGADKFFGEPAVTISDLMQVNTQGEGMINILASEKLMQFPKVYATMLLWLLSELFENLPEAGDLEKPKLVFFFDEAHLLFDEIPKVVLEKIEQVARLVRSKGVGIYFVSQSPLDIPDIILGQLGNRVQHALRAFTPKDQKSVRTAAQTFRSDGEIDVEKAITELGVGEALISFLDEKGTPEVVERSWVYPPTSRLTPLTPDERRGVIQRSKYFGIYENLVDRESAYEVLKKRAEAKQQESKEEEQEKTSAKTANRQGFFEAFLKSTLRTIGSQVGRQVMRGILGSITKK